MIICKTGCSKKEKRLIENVLYNTVDLHGDFYVTKDNVRIFLRDNPDIFYSYLNKGDVVVFEENNEEGIGLVTGWSDRSPRKYVKILTKDEVLAGNLLKMINWQTRIDLYAKIKKNNPLLKVFQRNQYQFIGNRGAEVLLMRKYIYHPEIRNVKDETQYDYKIKKNI